MNLIDGVCFVLFAFIEFFFYVDQLLNCIVIGTNTACEYVDNAHKELFRVLRLSDVYVEFVFILKCVLYFVFYPYLTLQCASTQKPEFWQMNCDFVWYEPIIGFFVCTFIASIIQYYMKNNQPPPAAPIVFHHLHRLQSSIFAGG